MISLRRVTCVLVNETGSNLIATSDKLNYKIEQGELVGTMPCPVAADAKGPFTLTQSVGSTVGPSGWACYELELKQLVFQIGFGDPALGADSFHIGTNYLDKLGEAVTAVKFFGSSGEIDPTEVPREMNLTVEYHLGFREAGQVASAPKPTVQASQVVAAPPGGSATVVVPPYFAKWNQPGITQKRKKVLAAIGKTYPMLWQATDAPAQMAAAENGGGKYKNVGVWKGPGTTCTSSCPMIGREVAPKSGNKWSFDAHLMKPGWTPWGTPGKKMPSVGDVYLLYRDEVTRPLPPSPAPPVKKDDKVTPEWKAYYSKVALMNPHLRHVGIIVQVPTSPSEIFITADGGQKAHGVEAAHLAKRAWTQRKPGPSDAQYEAEWKKYVNSKEHSFAKPIDNIDYAYFVGGAESRNPADGNRLIGWVDIDQVEFADEAFDKNFTEADYEALGAKIDGMK